MSNILTYKLDDECCIVFNKDIHTIKLFVRGENEHEFEVEPEYTDEAFQSFCELTKAKLDNLILTK